MSSKLFATIIILLATTSLLQAQKDILDKIQPKEPSYVRRGNQAYEDERYADAMTYYLKALDHDKNSNRALFNLGDTYYQKSNFDTAANAFNRAAMEASIPRERADAFYNAGNAHYRGQNYDKAIESYISALQTDPTHPQARQNLAYAVREMQQQQQQQQQQSGDSDDEKSSDEDSQQAQAGEKEEQDENADQDPKKQEGKEETDQEKENPQGSQDQEGEEGKDQSSQDQKEGESEAGQNLNRNQMEALLDRLRQKEQQTMKDVQKRKRGTPSVREKDW